MEIKKEMILSKKERASDDKGSSVTVTAGYNNNNA
jgi:hypothetical protein